MFAGELGVDDDDLCLRQSWGVDDYDLCLPMTLAGHLKCGIEAMRADGRFDSFLGQGLHVMMIYACGRVGGLMIMIYACRRFWRDILNARFWWQGSDDRFDSFFGMLVT